MKNVVLVAVLSLSTLPLMAQKPQPVKIYVFSKPQTGFVDEARPISDSVKDIRDKIGDIGKDGTVRKRTSSRFPNLCIVDSPEEADVLLEVTFSGQAGIVETETTGIVTRGILGGLATQSTTKATEKKLPKIATVLSVPGSDYSKEFAVQEQAFWADIAHDVVEKVDAWAKINRDRLRSNKP